MVIGTRNLAQTQGDPGGIQEEMDEETEPNRGRISAITDILLNVGGIYEIRYKKTKGGST